MSTMSDIARLAGVSQGTVSNVLNNRGNVSAKKIKLVQEAARQVGYTMNAPAHQLRSSSSLSKSIGVILPNITEARYSAFYSALQSYWQSRNYQVCLWLSNDTPYYEKQAISAATSARVSGVLTVTCLADAVENYKTIGQYGGTVIYVERESGGTAPCIGYDYETAGRQMAGRVLTQGFHSAALVLGLSFFSNERLFEKGFYEGIAGYKDPGFQCRTYNTCLSTAFQSAFLVLENESYPECIVASEKTFCGRTMQALAAGSPQAAPAAYTVTTGSLDTRCDPAHTYFMDYSLLARKSSELLFMSLEESGQIPPKTTLVPYGFGPKYQPVYLASKKIVLSALLVQGQPSNAIMQMTPRFTAKTNIEVNYVTLPLEELTTILSQLNGNHFFDVIRTNLTTTPRFPAGSLCPISDGIFQDLTKTMYPTVVRDFSYSHGQAVAVPFDIGTYFYAYRKDLFTDSVIMRTYLEKHGEPLELPDDFERFNRISSFFTQSINPDSPVPYGTTGPANDMALIFTHFLFIYRNLGGRLADEAGMHFDRDLALKAIRLQMELMPWSLSLETSRRDQNVTNFIQEKTAIEIISTSYAARLLDLRHSSINGLLGFSHMPASTGTFGGGALAVPSGCREPEAAAEYIRWACGFEQAYLFTLLGGTTPHKPIYTEYDILQLYPWFELMDKAIETSYPVGELDIYDRYQLERFMGFTLGNIYCGVIPLDHCLDVLEQGMASYLLDTGPGVNRNIF